MGCSLLLAGCASLPRSSAPAIQPHPGVSPRSPWELPAEDLSSQRIYRVRFESEEGSGRFRLALKLERDGRFQLTATDPLGRSLWALDLEDQRALLIEHRARRFCRFGREIDLSSLYLGSFPVASLPALLLGRLPVTPDASLVWSGSEPEAAGGARSLSFLDAQGQRWSARFGEGLDAWQLRSPTGEARAELERDDDGWQLRDERLGLDLRWKQVVAEPLRAALTALPIPSGYAEGGCLPGS